MQITWYGQSCFQIISSPEKNSQSYPSFASQNLDRQVKILIDPFSADIGLKLPKLEADILLISHDHHDHNNAKAVLGNPFLIDTPGEYEVKRVFIQGISAFHDNVQGKEKGRNVIYAIETEEIRICHLGDLGQNELSGEQLEKIGNVDILMIPVGGVYTIDAKEAAKVMMQLEPKITIPMHYKVPKLSVKIEGLDKFLKTIGLKSIESQSKFSVKKKDIAEDEAKIVILEP